MQVKRVCSKCGNEYYVEQSDEYNICHNCYLNLDKIYRKNKDFFNNIVKKEVQNG